MNTRRRQLVLATIFVVAVATGALMASRSDSGPIRADELIPPTGLMPDLRWIVADRAPDWLRCDEATLPAHIGPQRNWYHSPADWDGDERLPEPSDTASWLDQVRLSVVVLEPTGTQPLNFDDIVAAIAACEPSMSAEGFPDSDLATRAGTPVNVGDAAVQLEAMFGNPIFVAHGHVTIVEFDEFVVVAMNERSTVEWATDQRYEFDTWSAGADADLMPTILRRHLDDVR